jgi:hypothetical protein
MSNPTTGKSDVDTNKEDTLFPSVEEMKERLQKSGKILRILGWSLTGSAVIVAIVFWNSSNWSFLWGLVILLVAGQAFRFWGRYYIKRAKANSPQIVFSHSQLEKHKEEQESIVREYFESHKDIAAKVLQMDELAKKGRYQDAYNIAGSLLKLDLPKPIQLFLKNRRKRYIQYN